MPKRLTNNVITGSDKRLGLYFYYSPHFGANIIRRTTSLTGIRVKTDKAFKGFRESGNRMKQASPIAASLYKLIPNEIKQYRVYRVLTGEALKMIKAGQDTELIFEELKRLHIDPLLQEAGKKCIGKTAITPGKNPQEKGLKSIIRFPESKPHYPAAPARRLRYRVRQHNVLMNESQTAPGYANLQGVNSHVSLNTSMPLPANEKHVLNTKTHKFPELIYMGRLPECKKLKMWVYSSQFPGSAG
jgi:hypothetical protein